MEDRQPPPPDYTSWSSSDLVRRVTELEAELRARNASHSASNIVSPLANVSISPPKKKQQKKPAKPFDASRYHTRLIALKFAYLGGNYNGFEHHANNSTPLPTIEEEIWRALRKTRLVFPEFPPGARDVGIDGEEEVCWEGLEYSKCGRTDRGVSAFGQVIGVRVRSSRPKEKEPEPVAAVDTVDGVESDGPALELSPPSTPSKAFDPIRDELSYIQILNRVLPPDIRILAWCPTPPADFSARFSCKERRYRYFFTNPAFVVNPSKTNTGAQGDGQLDIAAMRVAAAKYEGLHDFRNLCKIDGSKQLTNFSRRIFHAGIHEVVPGRPDVKDLANGVHSSSTESGVILPKLYYFEVRGSAFLWHQVRHLIAVLFLVGQGYEQPSIVDDLLNVEKTPAKPHYEMASDAPLVLWDCIFPRPEIIRPIEHEGSDNEPFDGYEDSIDWAYIGDEIGGREKGKHYENVEDGRYGRNGIMDELWALWRKRKIDEVLADSLMSVVAGLGSAQSAAGVGKALDVSKSAASESARVFDGSERPRAVGKYIPIMQRGRMETAEVINARWLARKEEMAKVKLANGLGGDE